MAKVVGKVFPKVRFYDQYLVDLYDRTWNWIKDFWKSGTTANGFGEMYFNYPQNEVINQYESIFSTFFLVYSNRIFPVTTILDNFYAKQEPSGAIRGIYSEKDGKPVFNKKNPMCVLPPLFSWAEYNIYHKIGLKKRVKDIMPVLEKYYDWLENEFKNDQNGLYTVPLSATTMENSPRNEMMFPVDFNVQQAINALYMSALGEIMNDKEKAYRYKRKYFSLKVRINKTMWHDGDGYYYDLDKKERLLRIKTIASFWPLLAEIPNKIKSERIINHLQNPEEFGLDNPFPSVAVKSRYFHKHGMGYRGSIFPHFTFMIVKGLEKYARYDLARQLSIRHLYCLLDGLQPDDDKEGTLWEAYSPTGSGPSRWPKKQGFPRPRFLPYTALCTISLMIENVIGFYISLPRKTIDWIIPTLEVMGIEDLSLKRNMIKIISNQSGRGWEIRLESEKLYYFTINILGEKKRTLPIPSGKCSILLDKL